MKQTRTGGIPKMKRIMITLLCVGLLGYGTQMIPWVPNIMAMRIADASESPGTNDVAAQKDHTMPAADKGHEMANVSVVDHHEAVQEAVDKALEARNAALEAKRLELEQSMSPAERKAAVQKAKAAIHEVQDALHQDIKPMDHEAAIKNPRPVVALEDHPSLSDNAHAVTHAAHQALDEADKQIETGEVKNYGDNGIHPIIRVMKREIEHLRKGLDIAIQAHADPEKVGTHALEIKAAVDKAKGEIEASRAVMRSSIQIAGSREDRRQAVEAFMYDVRITLVKLQFDLGNLLEKRG